MEKQLSIEYNYSSPVLRIIELDVQNHILEGSGFSTLSLSDFEEEEAI